MFLTDTMYTILTKLERRRMLAASIALRARIILLAHQRLQNSRIAELLDVERHCVGRWRRRWQESFDAILSIEMNEPQAVLERAIIDTLRDAHRSGSPGRFPLGRFGKGGRKGVGPDWPRLPSAATRPSARSARRTRVAGSHRTRGALRWYRHGTS